MQIISPIGKSCAAAVQSSVASSFSLIASSSLVDKFTSVASSFSPVAIALSLVVSCSFAFPSPVHAQQVINGVNIFPANHFINTRIDNTSQYPADAALTATILNNTGGSTRKIHPDWGAIPAYGIPYNVVPGSMAKYKLTFQYASESDPGPYPVSNKLAIEGGTWASSNSGDRHVLMIDTTHQKLYELFSTYGSGTKYTAGSGAVWSLTSNKLRPDSWTSADAAGLPIFPLLVNYSEAVAGPVKHAFRCTFHRCNNPPHIWPARHDAGGSHPGYPSFGQRFRLKASYPIPTTASPAVKNIMTALKQYGMFCADIGSDWYITGAPDSRWTDNDLQMFKNMPASAFEAIKNPTVSPNDHRAVGPDDATAGPAH